MYNSTEVMTLDTNMRIQRLMAEKGWTEYRLAKESGLSQSTITNLFKRNTVPGISTLESICKGFGISLAQFFSENGFVELDAEQTKMFEKWKYLSPKQKTLIIDIIDNM